MDDCMTKARQSIDHAIDTFLKRINEISENGPYRKVRSTSATFPMLGLANDEFYEYSYFERILEWYTRDLLINSILHDLIMIHKLESIWPDTKNYAQFSTESFEDIFPFEFIFVNDGEKIGVRYTGLCSDDATKLKRDYKVKKILQIKWSENLNNGEKNQQAYDIITPRTFFEKYLSREEFEIFLSKVLSAIETANIEIGFETIPRLSMRYLSNFKAERDKVFANMSFEDMRYQALPGSKDSTRLSDEIFSADDYAILNRNFKKNCLYKALFGAEGFAKCFITAEYQFEVFKQGHNFDYTSVVCGYFKAVEQLLYKLLLINLEYQNNDKLWIKRNKSKKIPSLKYIQDVTVRNNPITGKPQVIFEHDFLKYFDTTLGSMIWFLNDNVNGWNISDAGRLTVHSFLLNFASDCRNDHFHKDNIDNFGVVTRIRNNAILIIYLLLGGYKLAGNRLEDCKALGIEDDSFDRMYKKIQELPNSMTKFTVYFDDQAPIKAYRYYIQEPTVYDENGAVGDSKIRFVAVDVFSCDEYNRAMQGEYRAREFTLRKDNMPKKISYINGRQEEIFISW